MKRLVLLSFIIISVLFLSGCQLLCEFVIVNKSGAPVEITYEVKNPNFKSFEPYYMTLEEFNDNETKWRKFSDDRKEIDTEKGIVKVKLASKEVLRLESVDDQRIEKNPYEELNTKILKIQGENGLLHFQENQVFEQFKPEYRNWAIVQAPTYVFYYE